MKNEPSDGRTRNGEGQKGTIDERKKKTLTSCTSYHTLCGVGYVIQGDVCPHVSTHLCLEGHSERCWVGQDDISVCPLVAMLSSGCPHQQTYTAGSDGVDL